VTVHIWLALMIILNLQCETILFTIDLLIVFHYLDGKVEIF